MKKLFKDSLMTKRDWPERLVEACPDCGQDVRTHSPDLCDRKWSEE